MSDTAKSQHDGSDIEKSEVRSVEHRTGSIGKADSNELREKGLRGSAVLVNSDLMNNAYAGEDAEHQMGVWEAAKSHPMACFWAFIFCFTIVSTPYQPIAHTADMKQVMESFDMFLNGNFVAQDAFKRRYGVPLADGKYAIETKWQSALFQSGQCGAFIGVFLAGPITNRIGYRWTTILALILMNATIFISFFVSRLTTHTDTWTWD